MKFIKKIYAAMLFLPVAASATGVPVGNCPDALNGGPACNTSNGLPGMITTIANTVLLLIGVVAVLFLILGGFQYVSSAGNPEQVNKAKNTIFYAIIGIIVALLAYVAVQFVVSQLS